MEENILSNGERKRTLFLLFLAIALYFFANFQRTVIPGAIFSELQKDLNTPAASITAMGAFFMYIYAVSQLFSGILVDKYGGHRLMTFGGFLFCAGSILFPLGNSLFMLYASRVITGIGASTIYLSVVKETKRAFPGNFGPAMGFAMLIGYTGSMAANAPFVGLIHHTNLGWRNALLSAGILLAGIWLLFCITRFTVKMPETAKSSFSFRAFLPAVKKHNWPLYLLSSLSFSVFYCFQTVTGKKFLEDYCHISLLTAGWILTITGALSAFASFITPFLSRLAGNRRRPFMLIMGSGTFLATFLPLLALCLNISAPWFFTGTLFLLALSANMTPVFLAILSETNPDRTLGACTSFSNFFAYMLVALLGTFAGFLMDLFPPQIMDGVRVYGRNSYIAVYLFLTLPGTIAFLSSLKVPETNGKEYEEK